MTKDEFLTQFNELISSPTPDALAIENFRSSVLEDYDALLTAQTAVSSFSSANEELTSTNKALQETNMKLIMLHPEAINLTSSSPSSSDTSEPLSQMSDEQKDEALTKVLEGFGVKKGD